MFDIKNWIEEMNKTLDKVAGYFILAHEEHLAQVTFCDGHATHTGTVADLREAVKAAEKNFTVSNQDDGSRQEAIQALVELNSVIANAVRVK